MTKRGNAVMCMIIWFAGSVLLGIGLTQGLLAALAALGEPPEVLARVALLASPFLTMVSSACIVAWLAWLDGSEEVE